MKPLPPTSASLTPPTEIPTFPDRQRPRPGLSRILASPRHMPSPPAPPAPPAGMVPEPALYPRPTRDDDKRSHSPQLNFAAREVEVTVAAL